MEKASEMPEGQISFHACMCVCVWVRGCLCELSIWQDVVLQGTPHPQVLWHLSAS